MEIPGSMPPLIQEMLENSEGLEGHGAAGGKGRGSGGGASAGDPEDQEEQAEAAGGRRPSTASSKSPGRSPASCSPSLSLSPGT